MAYGTRFLLVGLIIMLVCGGEAVPFQTPIKNRDSINFEIGFGQDQEHYAYSAPNKSRFFPNPNIEQIMAEADFNLPVDALHVNPAITLQNDRVSCTLRKLIAFLEKLNSLWRWKHYNQNVEYILLKDLIKLTRQLNDMV
ncbi:hypothetical protein D915_003910 [Fasciola hepatica]|uniref:Uncharacterized protein n=1 Tax=Fasciola hepatica TaxID=6192 RepID=A0A2H1CIR4_FASHE|nr:hypothetical protein D915_003910 [Fasciola hepatica]